MSLVNLEQAIKILNQGDVVALPTETVYGLAGLIDNNSALLKIFSTKKRPFFDPLIVHVKNLKQAEELAHWGALSTLLAEHFWPGPLTIVLPKKDQVSDLITSGGPTVGLRSPAHPIAQEILSQLDKAFAAPSANSFGHTSPTKAQHVLDEFDNTVAVVDGGLCEKGIESTVIEIQESSSTIIVLRPGVITKTQINDFLATKDLAFKIEEKIQTNSPGHLKNHYQPTIPLVLAESNSLLNEAQILEISKKLKKSLKLWELNPSAELTARQLYKDLRQFSKEEEAIFLQLKDEWTQSNQWTAILDRIRKACHFYATSSHDDQILLSKKK